MRQLIILCAASFFLVACAGSEPASEGGLSNPVYPITAAQADRVLIGSFQKSFAGSRILRIKSPYPGYSTEIAFFVDRHRIFAIMEPALGKKPNGQTVTGYVFRVFHRGTLLISGPSRARQLRVRIHRRAMKFAKPLQYAGAPGFGSPSESKNKGSGSGFVINANGDVLTNFHVAGRCQKLFVVAGGIKYPAALQYGDRGNDLAVIRSTSLPIQSVAKFRTSQLNLGEKVVVVGFPIPRLLGTNLKVTTGNISGLIGQGDRSSMFQFTAPIQPGNSGGPVLDGQGAIAGIASSKLSEIAVAKRSGTMGQLNNFGIKPQTAVLFLRANRIAFAVSRSKTIKSTVNIAAAAKRYTVQVLCN